MNKSLLALAMTSLFAAGSASAADIVLLNEDAPGVGLNSTLPATPVGGNPGTTRGQQAINVYEFAMNMWGAVVQSPVQIKVYASFAPLTCTSTSGVLGSAGANWIALLNDGTRSRAYGSALADSLVGYDIFPDPSDPGDIASQFNGNLGLPGCLDGSGWYFGLDGNTPAGKINFLNVVMHEIGHGLGAQGFLNKTSGALISGYSDAYTRYAYDNVLNKSFEDLTMTNAQRATAMKTPGRTVWIGTNVNSTAPLVLGKRVTMHPTAPAALVGKDYEVGYAAFGPLSTPANFTNHALVLINDGNVGAGTVTDGCSALGAGTTLGSTIVYTNAAAVAGNIAVIDRGTCSFEYKAKIAQDNGAIAVIIVNNAAGPPVDMAAVTPSTGVSIPTVMVSQADGLEIKNNITGAAAGLFMGNLTAGTDNAGRVRLYSPTVVASGSTFSHFDTVLSPDALMEPFDSPTVQAQFNVDLTPGLFADIGWVLNPGNGNFANCDTGVDAVAPGGIVIGANVEASNDLCLSSTSTRTKYQACMTSYKNSMVSDQIITSTQGAKVATCIKRQVDQYGK